MECSPSYHQHVKGDVSAIDLSSPKIGKVAHTGGAITFAKIVALSGVADKMSSLEQWFPNFFLKLRPFQKFYEHPADCLGTKRVRGHHRLGNPALEQNV